MYTQMSYTDPYLDRFKQIIRKIRLGDHLILIWGSSPSDKKHYKVRREIRKAIQKEFPHAKVFFSEDRNFHKEVIAILPAFHNIGVVHQEIVHLWACDFGIAMDTSAGPAAEIAVMVGSSLGSKLYVLTHKRFKGIKSFPAAVRKHTNQKYYTDKQFKSSKLTKFSVNYCWIRLIRKAIGEIGVYGY